MKLWKLGMATLGTGVALSLVSVSHAQIALQPQAMQLMVTCAGGAPAATIDLTATPTNNDVTSPDVNYTCAGCRRYVVDIKLPANVGGQMFMPNVTMVDSTSNQAACEASQMTVHYWRKAAGATTFASVGGGTTRGVWTGATGQFGQNTCNQNPITGYVKQQFNIAGGDTYRIDVGAVMHSLPVKVKVGASMQKIPG